MPYKDPEKKKAYQREYMRRYYSQNKEYYKSYYQENKDKIKETSRKWFDNNRDESNRRRRERRSENRDSDLERQRKWRDNNKEYIAIKQKEDREYKRRLVSRYKTIKSCAVCGYRSCSQAMDLHHVDPSTKEKTVSQLMGYSIKKIKDELSKCVVLCANCHRELHAGVIKLPTTQLQWNI